MPGAQAAHSLQLIKAIEKRRASSPLFSFYDYMQMALYEPGLGYYMSGTHKLGSSGDFVTAPLITPLFSQCLAKQCAEILSHLSDGSILEFGAGNGVMASDILQSLQAVDQLPEHYFILEVSPDLIERQQKQLQNHPELFKRVVWLTQLPKDFRGIVLANEVLDAMPIELFKIGKQQVEQAQVNIANHGFELTWNKANPTLSKAVSNLKMDLPIGYQSELNPQLAPWVAHLFDAMDEGVCLFIDYGFVRREYYHPSRHDGTLMCHYQHHAHPDPFHLPGLCDITAHVDFTALAEAADDSGFHVAGFNTQANFLMNLDILNLVNAQDSKEQLTQSKAIQKLLMPHEMGELFKTMALSKSYDYPLQGFASNDQRHRL